MEEGIRVNFVGSSYSLPRFNPIIPSYCPDTKTKTKCWVNINSPLGIFSSAGAG